MSTPAIDHQESQDRASVGVSRIAYTIDEAAHALGVSRRVIEGLINRRELRTRLIGRRQLISVDALRKLFP